MATHAHRHDSWNWLRVGAWSGSVATHLGILLLAALPVAVPLKQSAPEPIEARWIEDPPPPPALPEPPPPVAPHPVRAKSPPAPVPVQHDPAVPAPPTPVATAPAAPAPADAPSIPGEAATADIGSGGATQELAYASPLHPRYPPASVRAREQGTVLLRVLVDESGAPAKIEIARSSGHARLDASARDAVAHAKFRPVMRGGKAVPVWGIVPVAFRLDSV